MALFNRKNKEDKKKGGENIVGKIIYIFLLFAPLFSILTTCMYVIFNKNAYLSYSGTDEITELTPINSQLKINTNYYFDTDNQTNSTTNTAINVYSNSPIIYSGQEYVGENKLIYFQLYYTSGPRVRISYYNNNNEITSEYMAYSTTVKLKFNFTVGSNFTVDAIYTDFIKEVSTNVEQRLDNAFNYSLDKVENTNVFNWSKETGTYTVLQTTCTGLGITNTFTPMLLAYWLIISVIYFIYDIALMLIWILHRKIHELTESV